MGNKITFTFKSTDSNIDVHAVKWVPNGEIKAVLQICHGMTEFIERYEDFARYLNEYNILVVGHDHLGHGDTARTDDELGYFSDWAGNGKLVSDIFRLKGIIRREYPNVPYFILGQSFGSLLVREYIARFKDDINGAIVMGTMNHSTFMVNIAILMTKVIALFRGKKYRSGLINMFGVGGFNRKFIDEGRNSWLTRDKEIVKWYNKEPLCNFVFTLSAYQDLFEGVKEVNNPENILNINKNLPILLMSGDNDPVGDFGCGVKRLYKTLKGVGLNVRLKLYKDCRHELLNELNKQEVYNDILRWLFKYM